jgi:small subunit ribosomal protein S2
MSDFSISVQELFDASVHYGHRTHKWNPRVRNYLFGEREGIHIFDLQKTAKFFEGALSFVKKAAGEGKTFLFVGTKPQALHIVSEHAKRAGMPFVTQKWIPGLLTNFSTLARRISYLRDLRQQAQSGELEKYTKKEISQLKKTIAKLEATLGGVSEMRRLPDVVVVVDALRDQLAVREARKMKIPVVGVVDSNASPLGIDFVIPGNDDAVKALELYSSKLADAVLAGKKSAKASA